jgi:hypothetical protein
VQACSRPPDCYSACGEANGCVKDAIPFIHKHIVGVAQGIFGGKRFFFKGRQNYPGHHSALCTKYSPGIPLVKKRQGVAPGSDGYHPRVGGVERKSLLYKDGVEASVDVQMREYGGGV